MHSSCWDETDRRSQRLFGVQGGPDLAISHRLNVLMSRERRGNSDLLDKKMNLSCFFSIYKICVLKFIPDCSI